MTFVVLLAGQSNAQGTIGATDGDRTILPGVKVWNSPAMGEGTAWVDAAYGAQPFNIGAAPWSASVGIGFANLLHAATGREVYLIVKAEGGRRIETFLKPATLAANGWSAGVDNSVYLYPDVADAIAAIPGRAKTTLDFVLWQQGEANSTVDDATTYAAKLTALVGDLTSGGLYNPDNTHMMCGGLIPGHAWRDVHKAAVLAAGLLYVHGDGLPDQGDGLHYTGAGLLAMGQRFKLTGWLGGTREMVGVGSPEYQVSCSRGSSWVDSASGEFYVKEAGWSNTGWAKK